MLGRREELTEGVAVDRARVLLAQLGASLAIVVEPQAAVTRRPVAKAASAVLRAQRGVQRVRLEPSGGFGGDFGARRERPKPVRDAERVETGAQIGSRALLERAIGRVEQRVARVVRAAVVRVPAGCEPALDLALGDEPLERTAGPK